MKRTVIVDALQSKDFGSPIQIKGWVRTRRGNKNVNFIALNDGSTINNIQVVVDIAKFGEDFLKPITTGSCICVEGTLVESMGKGQSVEVQAETIQIYGTADPETYPLQKKGHTLEFLRTIPHLRVRTRMFEALFTVRDQLAHAIHGYFHKNGYKYVQPPIITGSDCEGAGEMFRVTTHPYSTEYKTEEEYYANDFFGKKAGLTVSAQLEGEMAAMGLNRIYTFGPTFRAENSNTTRHAAEFWHVEPEVCFADIDDIIEIAEDFIKSIIKNVLENCPDEIEFFDTWVEKGLKAKLESVISSDFGRVNYTDAIEILKKSGKEFKFPVEWGEDLATEHEKYLTEEYFKKPLFVVNYPKDIKSFYMKQNPDGKTVAATDLLVPGVGEIIGCSEREADLEKLKEAMLKRNMNLDSYVEYIDTRKFGSVPHSGFGLGFERALMYITGIGNIRDTLLFPRTVGSL